MYGIFTYIYHKKSTIQVGKYIPYMDGMGEGNLWFGREIGCPDVYSSCLHRTCFTMQSFNIRHRVLANPSNS